MLKILFLKSHEIEEAVEKDLKTYQTCEVSFNEAENKEQILIKEDNEIQDKLSMESIFPILDKEYNVSISKYDVYEVGYFGDGFAFSIT
jgi:hypothetical protein